MIHIIYTSILCGYLLPYFIIYGASRMPNDFPRVLGTSMKLVSKDSILSDLLLPLPLVHRALLTIKVYFQNLFCISDEISDVFYFQNLFSISDEISDVFYFQNLLSISDASGVQLQWFLPIRTQETANLPATKVPEQIPPTPGIASFIFHVSSIIIIIYWDALSEANPLEGHWNFLILTLMLTSEVFVNR